MPVATSATETFLIDFHNAHAGLTAKVYGTLTVVFRGIEHRSSYEILAATVPGTEAPMQVLDLGCGDGFLLSMLAARSQSALTLCGVDMSFAELNLARAHLPSTVALRQARAQALPFAPATFDFVLSHLALMLMDDAERVLREALRVMKPGGTFAAVIGASPLRTAALAEYVDILVRHPRAPEHSEVRIGDDRFRHPDGTHAILSRSFHGILVEAIHVARRLTPDELWRWLLNKYDLHPRSEADRHEIEREFLAAVARHCDADGQLEYVENLQYVSATA